MEVLKTILSFSKNPRRFGMTMVCLLVGCFTTALKSPLQEQLPEYQVKAVFLYNFSKFVQWPEKAFPDDDSPFVIGVLGDDPFEPYLEETVNGEQLYSRPLIIKRYESPKEVGDCHILFIAESDKDVLKEILEELSGRNILTVGEARGFGKLGGIIEFEKKDNKIRFKINPESAQKSQLEISAKLLRLAELVSTENDYRP